MTRKTFMFLLMLMPLSAVFAQKDFKNLDEVIAYFSKIEGVEYDVLPSTDILGSISSASKIDSVESLILEECGEEHMKNFFSIDMAAFDGYEVMSKIVDEDDVVTFLIKPMQEKAGEMQFSELVIIVQEADEGVLFRVRGIFSKSDLANFGNSIKR